MEKASNLPLLLPFSLFLFLSLFSSTRSSTLLDQPEPSKHFVLVHGACLGGWSWYKVTDLLRSSGHNVTTLDMAAQGINLTPVDSLANITQYFKPLLDFMEALPPNETTVLVGHSLGGLGISMAMEQFPQKISVAIFVTAAMPGPLLPFSIEEQRRVFEMYSENMMKVEDGSMASIQLFLFTESQIANELFPLSPLQDVTLANSLVRPQPMFGMIESMKELGLTRKRYGSVKRAFVISEEDKMTPKILVDLMLLLNPPDHVAKIQGSDHMVMTSQPHDLADQLQDIAQMFDLSDI